jgi:ribosomal protein S18 acetylase RimI-like enzyme
MKSSQQSHKLKSDIVIRLMRVSETAKVARLVEEIISNLSFYTPAARASEIKKYRSKTLKQKIREDKYSVLIAKEGKALVGFCFSQDEGSIIWLEWFAVDSTARGSGVGRLLLKALDDSAKKRKAHKIWCDTRVGNLASIKLLESEGYKKIANLNNFWHKQDYFLFEKEVH